MIKNIQRVLEALHRCDERLLYGMSISDMIHVFDEHGLTSDRSSITYGQDSECVDNMSLRIDEGFWINLQFGIDGSHPIEISVEYVDDNGQYALMLHSLHCNEVFHMELFVAEEIKTIRDISETNWYACGNNCYIIGPKSLSLLQEIDSENGVIRDRNGRAIPEFWKNSKEYQGIIV